MIIQEIHAMLQDYFEALYTQDLTLFDKVFHSSVVLYGMPDGVLNVRPFDAYRNVVIGRASPKDGNHGRKDEILSIDMMSPNMAMVKVRLQLYNNIMMDYLNLLKIDGKWVIVAKMWHHAETLKPA